MIPPGVNNPFLTPKLDDTARLPAGDVPELHAPVLGRCGQMLEHARQSGQGIGLFVVGEAGSGKSHLIAQLRGQLAATPSAVLAAVPMKGAFGGRLWRHLRERLVTELLHEYAAGHHGANGLLRILRNRFPKWAGAVQDSHPGGLLGWLVGKSKSRADLLPHLTEAGRSGQFHYQFLKVLPKVADPDLSQLAHDWLRGQQLGGEDLASLGLSPTYPSEQDQEVVAREVVLSLLRLAGDRTVIVLCFDEVEAIQSSNWDAAVLREFTTLVTDLVGEPGPRVVATLMRPNFKVELDKSVEVSNIQKMCQFSATIPHLTWEQTVRVVMSRADAEPTCRAARAGRPAGDHWPVGTPFLDKLYREHRRVMTPRHVIKACAVEFERLKAGGPVGPAAGDDLARKLDEARRKFRKAVAGINFDAVLGVALPWLVETAGLPLTRANAVGAEYGDFSLVFTRPALAAPAAVSFCSQEPKSLWHKQDRLLAAWGRMNGKKLGSLAVLRPVDYPMSKGVAERFDRMRAAGIRVVMLTADQLAELAAYQAMFTAAASGEMTRTGKTVEKDEFSGWARDNLTDAVRATLGQVLGDGAEPIAAEPTAASVMRPVAMNRPAVRAPAKAKG